MVSGSDDKEELLRLLEEKERLVNARANRRKICAFLASKHSREQANKFYATAIGNDSLARALCEEDLFFLLTVALGRKDVDRDWLFDRCREVQNSPNGHLDLWARDHYKSTIITFALTIQDVLKDPEVTIGIFSHTRDIATAFLDQIKRELERNEYLKELFPDILYADPKKESQKWSLDGGLIVKRKTNPKEATVEAWGLVDGQPTGKHFKKRIYDDVVTLKSVTNPDQIKKTTQALELSQNLGTKDGIERYVGTRYHLSDTYRSLMDRGSVVKRVYPATHNGKMDGDPVLLDRETLMKKRRDMGPYTFGTQMLQDPVADKAMGFRIEWISSYERLGDIKKWNLYIIVDPASKKKATSDYTVMAVIGLAPDNNFYVIDAIRDRMNLTQRARKLFEFHRKYSPKGVGYEEYGMQADIEHMQYEMELQNYRFSITPLGGSLAKEDRIKKLVPIYEQKRFWTPKQLTYVDSEGRTVDFVKVYNEDELLAFPVCVHDDMLDCIARILDQALEAKFPKAAPASGNQGGRGQGGGGSLSWMG